VGALLDAVRLTASQAAVCDVGQADGGADIVRAENHLGRLVHARAVGRQIGMRGVRSGGGRENGGGRAAQAAVVPGGHRPRVNATVFRFMLSRRYSA